MTHWLYPANVKYYDVLSAFSEPNTYWPMNSKAKIGDTIYIYLASPHKQIAFVSEVIEVDLDKDDIISSIESFIKGDIDEKKNAKPFMKLEVKKRLTLEDNAPARYQKLKEHGLTGMLMGARKLENNPLLMSFIKEII